MCHRRLRAPVLLALVVAVALAAAGPGTVADTTSRPALRSFQLVSVGGGSGGVTGHAIWATTWWNGTPEGPGPYEGTPGAGQPICIWHDLGSGVANLDGGLSEASLPVSFWKPPDGGGHPGIWGIDQWAAMVMRGGRATDHFDLVACPDTDQVPPTAGEVEADLPLAYPPKSAPLYVWLFWDTVPDPPSGHRLAIIGQALARTRLPSPGIGTSPSEVGGVIDSTVVNLPTWLWVNNGLWRTYSAFASGGGYRATVWAVPVTVQWSAAWDFPSSADDPEGGTTFGPEVLDRVCQGPGQVYNPDAHGETTDCSFDFTQSSFGTYQRLRAAVTWDVSWALSDRAGVVGGEGSLGTIVTSASRPLRVLQVESVITGG